MPKHPVQPPEWIDAAPIIVREEIEIAAPPSAVWARIADHETWPEWFTALDRVERIGTGVEVLSRHDGVPVLVRSARFTVAAFHPELTDDARLHQLFLDSLSD